MESKATMQQTINQAINQATQILKSNNIDEPNIKAKILMEHSLNKNRQYIVTASDQKLTQKQTEKYYQLIEELSKNIPLEHIIYKKEFMGISFYVDENVLIPRPDTEILVEEVIKIAKQTNAKKILDLCTGSGAIVVSLAKFLPNCEFVATDISKKALEIAEKNAISNNVENRVKFIQSDVFGNLKGHKFDIIVSNPPYIETAVIKSLDENVKKEPHIALDGGEDGLDFYRRIYNEGYTFLNSNGFIYVEIGYNQKFNVTEIIQSTSNYKEVQCIKDLANNDRVIVVSVK